MATQSEMKKRIQVQNMIIVALAIIIFVLVAVSGTAAWYIRSKSDTTEIRLSDPVNIEITENGSITTDILKEFSVNVYPGDTIGLNLGVKMGKAGTPSSPAYVRVKLEIFFENQEGVYSQLEDVADSDKVRYKDTPDGSVWEKVNFAQFAQAENEDIEDDYWFVLKDYDELGHMTARVATNQEDYLFLDGFIELDKHNLTNNEALCKFHINYVVEAIQKENVPDPLANPGFGPWWDFQLGDIEDIEGQE
ncbi:MAG: hypothetical protein E7345_03310 [Clostridiales bacterium]|nr:hypothetical protein [Clostridiales bacterium]